MGTTTRPYCELFSEIDAQGKGSFHAVAAIQLVSCPSGRLLNSSLQAELLNSLARQIDFINSLYQLGASVCYAIRYISRQNRSSFTAGSVETCIFCHCTAFSEADAQRLAEEQAQQLLIQLCATYPDHVWQMLRTKAEFEPFWRPFNWESASLAEIRRREELVHLDSIRPVRKLGFGAAQSEPQVEDQPLYFVHSFLPHPGQLERLLRMILLSPQTLVFTVMVSPVSLSAEEEGALYREIAASEGYRTNPSSNVQRIQEHRAVMVGNGLMNQMLSLQDAPFYMTISMASSEKLPATLLEAAGLAVSASIGEAVHTVYTEPALIQMGGYDVVFPQKDEKATARRNLAALTQEPWGSSLAPVGMTRLRYMVNGHEAACAFRFPQDLGDGLPGLKTHTERSRPVPPELMSRVAKQAPGQTLLLGTNTYMGITNEVKLSLKERMMHMYLVGQTGTGKSTLMKTMLLSDMQEGRGCALIDPHGDLYEEMLALIPPERVDDVVLFDPADALFPVGLNLLEANTWEEKHFVTREMQAIIRRLVEDQYGPIGREYVGPFFFQHMNMNMLLAMSDNDNPGTLIQYYQIYHSADYWKRWIPLKTEDATLQGWVKNYLSHNNYTQPAHGGDSTTGEYLSNKFMDFVFDSRLRRIFGQIRSKLNFQEIMNDGKILLINLAKGLLGEANANFLGLILMAKIQAEAMKRAAMPPSKRRPFFLYVDEFQSLATENFTIMLSEARKFGIGLVLANQFVSQIKDPRIVQAIFGNVGSFLSFRLGREDAGLIEPQFLPYFDHMDLINLPNWQVAMRTTMEGAGLHPFTLNTILPRMQPDAKIASQVRSLSRIKYGIPAAEVDRMITEYLEYKPAVEAPEEERE
ncbi:MAG TPA: type IV secretion system DNA-binding domain-containing protein [Anaerolineaceae bacterium]|nr:type IV secretion system DNA-binding domain-containing protein [Anaerolineaceae bacterium]